MKLPFYTIGHSNRPVAEFVSLLHGANVAGVADVRKFPRSRTNPQFNIDAFGDVLRQSGMGYRHIGELGGRRGSTPRAGPSPNMLWTNRSFRNYADYAATAAFQHGLAELRSLGHDSPTAIMCAEAVWWRCHRRIIADYLLANGESVFHILARARRNPPRLRRARAGKAAF